MFQYPRMCWHDAYCSRLLKSLVGQKFWRVFTWTSKIFSTVWVFYSCKSLFLWMRSLPEKALWKPEICENLSSGEPRLLAKTTSNTFSSHSVNISPILQEAEKKGVFIQLRAGFAKKSPNAHIPTENTNWFGGKTAQTQSKVIIVCAISLALSALFVTVPEVKVQKSPSQITPSHL